MTRPIPPLVLDDSALIALFGGHSELHDLLERADDGDAMLVLPSCAIAEAEASLSAGAPGWEAILLTGNLHPTDLTANTAIEIGRQPGSLAARHVAHEALAAGATIVTRDRAAYDGLLVKLLVV
jgi:hypothetical protein